MTTSKRICKEFLLFKYGEIEKRALFEREATSLFAEFREWYRDTHWGKNPSGVSKLLFRKWLIENQCFFIKARN